VALAAGALERKLQRLAASLPLTRHLELIATQCALVENLDRIAAGVDGGAERELVSGDFALLQRQFPLRPSHAAGELLAIYLNCERCRRCGATPPRHVARPFSREVGGLCAQANR